MNKHLLKTLLLLYAWLCRDGMPWLQGTEQIPRFPLLRLVTDNGET